MNGLTDMCTDTDTHRQVQTQLSRHNVGGGSKTSYDDIKSSRSHTRDYQLLNENNRIQRQTDNRANRQITSDRQKQWIPAQITQFLIIQEK